MSLFGDSRAVRLLMPKYRPFRKSFFLDEGAATLSQGLGVLGGQIPGLYGGTIFGGCDTLGGSGGALNLKVLLFQHICGSLEGTRH